MLTVKFSGTPLGGLIATANKFTIIIIIISYHAIKVAHQEL
jgi:hypothetical protein